MPMQCIADFDKEHGSEELVSAIEESDEKLPEQRDADINDVESEEADDGRPEFLWHPKSNYV